MKEQFLNIPESRCISYGNTSNIIITEDMDIFVIQDSEEYTPYKNEVIQVPGKADLNFEEYYGDDGKANWSNETLPVYLDNGKLYWDY